MRRLIALEVRHKDEIKIGPFDAIIGSHFDYDAGRWYILIDQDDLDAIHPGNPDTASPAD